MRRSAAAHRRGSVQGNSVHKEDGAKFELLIWDDISLLVEGKEGTHEMRFHSVRTGECAMLNECDCRLKIVIVEFPSFGIPWVEHYSAGNA